MKRLNRFTREVQVKIHAFTLGTTLALAATYLGQGCTAGGA
jgi:hypothetical protein